MSSITHMEVKVPWWLIIIFSHQFQEILTEGAKDVEFLTLSDGGAGEPKLLEKIFIEFIEFRWPEASGPCLCWS